MDEAALRRVVGGRDVPDEYFGCPTSHLVLDGYELISQAGLPEDFEVIDDDPEWPEPGYGND